MGCRCGGRCRIRRMVVVVAEIVVMAICRFRSVTNEKTKIFSIYIECGLASLCGLNLISKKPKNVLLH